MGLFKKSTRLPSNIEEFLDRSGKLRMQSAANRVNKWVISCKGQGVSGGTAIGRNYDTLVLDITRESADIYITAEGIITFNGTEIETKQEFVKIYNQHYPKK